MIIGGIVALLTWFFSTQKIKSELMNIDEDRKAKQIENYNRLKEVKRKYMENHKIAQLATTELVSAFSKGDAENIRNNINEIRELVFNDLLLSFEEYQDMYEIIYGQQKNKFYKLYNDEYKTLLCNIIEIVKIINNENILIKAGLEKYRIYSYTINSIYYFMKSHFYFFDIVYKTKNYMIKKELLKVGN